MRTETTINDSRDVGPGRRLGNLPALRAIGFAANRRLLELEKLSQDCLIGEATLHRLTQPRLVDRQRVSALGFGEPRAMVLLHALCLLAAVPHGFANAALRPFVAQLMGREASTSQAAQMTYDLRRLRLHGLIEKIPASQRYRVSRTG